MQNRKENKMQVSEKLKILRNKMNENGISAVVIPNSDPHLSEYVSPRFKQLSYMTDFTGSAGTAVVTMDEAFLYTDGRYFLQASQQLPKEVKLMKSGLPDTISMENLLIEKLGVDDVLSIDGRLISASYYNMLKRRFPTLNIRLDLDLVGEVWTDRPELPKDMAFVHPEKYCTMTAKEKTDKVRDFLKEKLADVYVSSSLNDICYTMNIRGNDVKCTPVIYSYLIIDADSTKLYVQKEKINTEVEAYLKENEVELIDYDKFYEDLKNINDQRVFLDQRLHNALIVNSLNEFNELVFGNDPVYYSKTAYSDLELEHTKQAHIRDGAHLVRFAKWVYENADSITEYDCVEKLLECRSEDELFIENSFDPITGYGANGAIVHYKTDPNEHNPLARRGLFLVDSGGQYLDGTTDITRMYALGELTEEEKLSYTLVLKGHINVAMAVFKDTVLGSSLDLLARKPLYERGLNFNHGTGHSVGYVLGVHEGYARISPVAATPFKENIVVSNEPGFYKDGAFGIRIESLIAVKKVMENEWGTFLGFDTITMCPIDTAPIIKDLLTKEEIAWLNDYHKEVREKLSPLLNEEENIFLNEVTKAI